MQTRKKYKNQHTSELSSLFCGFLSILCSIVFSTLNYAVRKCEIMKSLNKWLFDADVS